MAEVSKRERQPLLFSVGEVVQPHTFEQLIRDTAIDPSIIDRWKQMMAKDEIVILGAKFPSGRFVGRVNVWLAPADEEVIREHYPEVPLINALHVNDGERGQGIASELMHAAEMIARERGKRHLGLGVEPDNDPARRLYEKLGYVYQPVGGGVTYTVAWDETSTDGRVRRVEAEALFMIKELDV
jgi:GNAT superfamily N-acetyltransferase